MVYVQICVGSSCHLKGTPQLVELLQNAVAAGGLEDKVMLMGSFCSGQCNRTGVTVTVNDTVHTGITPANWKEFWQNVILKAVREDKD